MALRLGLWYWTVHREENELSICLCFLIMDTTHPATSCSRYPIVPSWMTDCALDLRA